MNRVRRSRVLSLLALLLIFLSAVIFIGQSNCPPRGFALSPALREFVRLKNRTELPDEQDFDRRATLEALLRAGDDRGRWSDERAASVEGFVVAVAPGGIEAANCYSPTNRDTHVYVAARADAPTRERLVAEVTPRVREWARSQGADWSETALRRELVGRRVRVEGWLLFDVEHEGEAENTAREGADVWRATAWEIHPVTRLTVIN